MFRFTIYLKDDEVGYISYYSVTPKKGIEEAVYVMNSRGFKSVLLYIGEPGKDRVYRTLNKQK